MATSDKAIALQFELIDGVFNARETMEIITKMIHVKIKFHEDKISQSESNADIEMRELRIKSLQKDLYEIRRFVESHANSELSLNAEFRLEKAEN